LTSAESLNADGSAACVNKALLQDALRAQGNAWYELLTQRCPHLYADAAVCVSPAQLQQMREVIAVVERVVALEKGEGGRGKGKGKGVFYGYDFHLNPQGAHLIEINTNAGGAFLNTLLLDSQRDASLPGEALAADDLQAAFLAMFQSEWQLARGAVPLKSVAIVDEQPEEQYLYPEFLLAQAMFERAGIAAYIADPAEITRHEDGLYCGGERIDLIYNRLTDFDLSQHPVLQQARLEDSVVVTPSPAHYARYADKRNLARLGDAQGLRALDVAEADIVTLQRGLPETREVQAADREQWWAERKQWFFKPNSGYGSKGSYSGAKLTKRVFEDIMQGGYVAQRIALPGTRMVAGEDGVPQTLKFDVRCYVYDGEIQLIAARLYQGQTTNFRTPGGGFALTRVVG